MFVLIRWFDVMRQSCSVASADIDDLSFDLLTLLDEGLCCASDHLNFLVTSM